MELISLLFGEYLSVVEDMGCCLIAEFGGGWSNGVWCILTSAGAVVELRPLLFGEYLSVLE